MINKLQQLEGKKFKLYKNLNNYYIEMNIRMDEDTFAKNVQSNSKFHHEGIIVK